MKDLRFFYLDVYNISCNLALRIITALNYVKSIFVTDVLFIN